MTRNLKIILIILLIAVLIIMNNKIMPSRKEITDLELVRVIGVDNIDEPELTVVRNKLKASGGGGGDESSAEERSQEALTTRGKTFIEITEKFQTYTNKTISGGHVSYYVVGRDTATTDMTEIIHFLIGANQLRSNAKIYILKDGSAKEFLDKIINPEYKIGEKIDNMELNKRELGVIAEYSFKDLLETVASDRKITVIPTFKLIELDTEKLEEKDKEIKDFDFDGYAVFKEDKIIHFLTREQSRAYNIINNKLQNSPIAIKDDEGKNISLSIVNSKTDVKFEFDGDELKNIVIDTKLETDFKESQSKETVLEDRTSIEAKQNEQIKAQLEDVIKTSKDIDVDFIGILEKLRLKHPYKYKNIEKNWDEIWKDVNVEVKVESRIKRFYDFIQE